MSKDAIIESLIVKMQNTTYYAGAKEAGGYVTKATEVKELLKEKKELKDIIIEEI